MKKFILLVWTALLISLFSYSQNNNHPILFTSECIELYYGYEYGWQEIVLDGRFLNKIEISSISITGIDSIRNKYFNEDSTKLYLHVKIPDKIDTNVELLFKYNNRLERFPLILSPRNKDNNKLNFQREDTIKIYPDEPFNITYKVTGDKMFWDNLNIQNVKLIDARLNFDDIKLYKNIDELVVQGKIKYSEGILGFKKINLIRNDNIIISTIPLYICSHRPIFDSINKKYDIEKNNYQTIVLTGKHLYSIDLNSIKLLNKDTEFELFNIPQASFENELTLNVKILKDVPLVLEFKTKLGEKYEDKIKVPINKILPNGGVIDSILYLNDIRNNPSRTKLRINLGSTANGNYDIFCEEIKFLKSNIDIQNQCTFDVTIEKILDDSKNEIRTTIYLNRGNEVAFSIPLFLRKEPEIYRVKVDGKISNNFIADGKDKHKIELYGDYVDDIVFDENPNFTFVKVKGLSNKFEFSFNDKTIIESEPYLIYYSREKSFKKAILDSIILVAKPPQKVFSDYHKDRTAYFKMDKNNNEIHFLINAEKIDYSYGFQKIKLKANIYDEENNLLKSIYYNDNELIKFGNPIFQQRSKIPWTISDDLTYSDLRPFNKIKVFIIPVETEDDFNKIDPFEYCIEGKEIDKWRIEPSIPAMIFFYSNKKISNDSVAIENGAPDSLRYQILSGNLGFSIYRQLYKNNSPKKMAVGAYFLTSNILSTNKNENQIINKYDFTIIPYLQFKLYSNQRAVLIPIFIGYGFSYNSKRDQWMYGIMTGISINLQLK